jgi:hypothetical protein
MSRRVQLPLFLLSLVVLIAAVLLLGRAPEPEGTNTDGPATRQAASTLPKGSSPTDSAAPAEPPPAAPEVLPMPKCWQGLLALDQHGALDELGTALANAASQGDNLLATYLQQRLAERVGDDALAALQVIAWAEKSGIPGLYLEALKNTPAIQDAQVAERLLHLGENAGASFELRRASLEALETQHRFTPESMGRLKKLALDQNLDELAWMATRTLGRVMKEDFERTGSFQPYWQELLDIGQSSEEAAVRLLALEMPSYSNPLIDGSSLDALSELMRKDADKSVREMAALRLSLTGEPDKALKAFEAAFPLEQELCVRWAIFRFAVRAAGAQALPLLERFAALEPQLAPDYTDFKELYAAGATDFARIWQSKPERIQCHEDEG